ncbi:MAG TPA: galactokinase [Abditibacteriaceae bacterium]|jgi:galactokinase
MNIHEVFAQQFGADEDAFEVRSPGRVNLIGEHVDYNDGFVLPIAIPLEVRLKVRPRTDRRVELYAANFDERGSFSLDDLSKQDSWIDYVQGVASELADASVPLHGFEGVVISDVPVASGLSSSAAIEVASALAFTHLEQQPMEPAYLAKLCQRAENNFVGVNCGIMDQMAVAACRENHALLLDCRDLSMRQVPFRLKDHSLIVTDSAAPRELAGSAYNERRAQCEEGLRQLQEKLPHIMSLRDVTPEELQQYGGDLDPVVRKRVRHVVDEIARTVYACENLEKDNLEVFGECMNDSHQSLSELYEVSSPELDWLTSWARMQPGVLGSRLTGAGFGGCTVTLIENAGVDEFLEEQPKQYKASMGRDARCWVCTAVEGAQVL